MSLLICLALLISSGYAAMSPPVQRLPDAVDFSSSAVRRVVAFSGLTPADFAALIFVKTPQTERAKLMPSVLKAIDETRSLRSAGCPSKDMTVSPTLQDALALHLAALKKAASFLVVTAARTTAERAISNVKKVLADGKITFQECKSVFARSIAPSTAAAARKLLSVTIDDVDHDHNPETEAAEALKEGAEGVITLLSSGFGGERQARILRAQFSVFYLIACHAKVEEVMDLKGEFMKYASEVAEATKDNNERRQNAALAAWNARLESLRKILTTRKENLEAEEKRRYELEEKARTTRLAIAVALDPKVLSPSPFSKARTLEVFDKVCGGDILDFIFNPGYKPVHGVSSVSKLPYKLKIDTHFSFLGAVVITADNVAHAFICAADNSLGLHSEQVCLGELDAAIVGLQKTSKVKQIFAKVDQMADPCGRPDGQDHNCYGFIQEFLQAWIKDKIDSELIFYYSGCDGEVIDPKAKFKKVKGFRRGSLLTPEPTENKPDKKNKKPENTKPENKKGTKRRLLI